MHPIRDARKRRIQTGERLDLAIRWALILLTAPSLFAVNPNLSLGQYLHTSWTQEEGNALPPIQALAQTSDGYLWLGTSKGLIRFDGIRFTEWSPVSGPPLPSRYIGRLYPASDAGLWVGTMRGLCRIENGRVIRYAAAEKLACPAVYAMLPARLGRLWVINGCPEKNMLSLVSQGGSLQTIGTRDGLPNQSPRALLEDRQGQMWIGTDKAVCRWSPGAQANCSTSLNVSAMAEAGDGQLVVADDKKNQLFRLSAGHALPAGPHIPDSEFTQAMVVDRDGNIWMGTAGQGLLRIRGNRVDRFTRNDGLSSNVVSALLEDREGDIWVGTSRGLDRIRDPKAQLYSTLNGLSSDMIDTVFGGRDGAVWIGTAGGGLNRLAEDRVTVYSRGAGLQNTTVLAQYEDVDGKLWVATTGGLNVQRGSQFSEVLTTRRGHLENVFNIAGNRSAGVWIADSKLGVLAVQDGVARPVSVPASDTGDIVSLAVARTGEIWLGHQRGGITVVCNQASRQYTSRDQLGNGPVRALYEDRQGTMWAGTGDGLSSFRDARWTTWTTAQGLPEGGVQGIIEDDTGGLWLLTPAGVLRLPLSSLDPPAKPQQVVLYGPTEGLRLGSGMSNPRLTRSRDGRIWVCTEDGVAAIDPARLRRNPVPPPVVIEQVIADGRNYDPAMRGEIAFRGHDLQIVYTGISLMVPERVRFRYRLAELDRNWTEAGTRRNVSYMNLPPGHYRFQVIACNNDGLWNNAGAGFMLRVDPYFYQTKWFALLCVVTTALMVWFALRLKVRRVVSRMQLIAEERVRFSRELHDSLLQGFSGVVFLLEAAARQFETAPELARQRLDRAVDQADQSLREAREMIASLRIPALENNTLVEALRTTAEQMVSSTPVEFQFEVKGRAQKSPYNVEANLFMLAREAVTNALKHASAKQIRLDLCYTPKELHLTIQDDGVGFDPDAAAAKAGHWGFRGMRERARLIGARFTVDTAPGRGTTINITVPCRK